MAEENDVIYSRPSWNGSGTKLAFSRKPSHSAPGTFSIVVVEFDWEAGTFESAEFEMLDFEGIAWPSFARRNVWIAFSGKPFGASSESIFLLDLSVAEPAIHEIVPGGFGRPSFSPDDLEVTHMAIAPKGRKESGLWITNLVTQNSRFVFSKGTFTVVLAEWK